MVEMHIELKTNTEFELNTIIGFSGIDSVFYQNLQISAIILL